jgi:integrase
MARTYSVDSPRISRKKRRRRADPETPDLAAAFSLPPAPSPPPAAPAQTPPPNRSHHIAHTAPVATWDQASAPPVWTDARGYVRPPATMPGAGKGRAPASKGKRYPPDPPTVVEVVRLLNGCPDTPSGHRLRALINLLWRTGLRISEALALEESDLDPVKGSIVIRRGKGGKRRTIGMDPWGWDQLRPWLEERHHYPTGPVFCVLEGPTAGRVWGSSQVRWELHRLARAVGIRKRIHPHGFRHADLRVLSRYLSGISHDDVLDEARVRPLPTLTAPDMMEVLRGE